jgi:hypothetical protein
VVTTAAGKYPVELGRYETGARGAAAIGAPARMTSLTRLAASVRMLPAAARAPSPTAPSATAPAGPPARLPSMPVAIAETGPLAANLPMNLRKFCAVPPRTTLRMASFSAALKRLNRFALLARLVSTSVVRGLFK